MKLHTLPWAAITLITLVSTSSLISAADWPNWRGPQFNGSTDETGLPTKWSRTENIAWVADLPGASAATPVISGNRVFISTTDQKDETLLAIALDRETGEEVWRQKMGQGIKKDYRSTYAAPSPAADGEVVVFFYGNGALAAFDYDGKKLWDRNIQEDYGEFAFGWTFSTSPLLHDGKLYMQVLQRDIPVQGRGFKDRKNDSYLLALNPKTGEELWRHIRPAPAKMESLEAFTTPVPYEFQGRKQLLVIGGDVVTGHDPQNGKELWRWGTWNKDHKEPFWRLVPSPVATKGVVLVCAPKRQPVYAVQTTASGNLGPEGLLWKSGKDGPSSDVPTPAVYDGDFFVLSDVRKNISRIDPLTGQVKWTVRTPGRKKYEASPLVADGKIYIMNFIATVTVLDAKTGKLINEIPMDEPTDYSVRASIAAADGQLFIRTTRQLFCVGRK